MAAQKKISRKVLTPEQQQADEIKAFKARQEATPTLGEDDVGYNFIARSDFLKEIVLYRTPADIITYVKKEVDRMLVERQPILRSILSLSDQKFGLAKRTALEYIKTDKNISAFALRLIPSARGTVLPDKTANATPMDPAKLGNTLNVYLGNKVPSIPDPANIPAGLIRRGQDFDTKWKMLETTGSPEFNVYKSVDISQTPKFIPFDYAIAVLSQWGYGCATLHFKTVANDKRQDHWLVIEVPALLDDEVIE